MDAQALRSRLADELLDDDKVHAVGIGKDEDGNEKVTVYVQNGQAQTFALPNDVDSEDVIVKESNELVPETAPQVVDPESRKSKHRPVPAGVSAGHEDITAGTVGYQLTDDVDVFTASNNHVYANSDQGQQGDPIYQPGPVDGGSSSDTSALLEGAVPLEDGVTVDLAWGAMEVEHVNELKDVGTPTGQPDNPQVGDTVVKSGRTTQVTRGEVTDVHVSATINYGGSVGKIRLDDLFFTEDISDGGDSGSAVLHDDSHAPAGKLFAGSDSITVHMYAVNIESESGLDIVTDQKEPRPVARVTLTIEKVQEQKGDIKVQAVDGNGDAVEGATVAIDGPVSNDIPTDSRGFATFLGVPIGEYRIDVSKTGYESTFTNIDSNDFE